MSGGSGVARRHGLSPQQLFGWRRQVKEARAVASIMMNCGLFQRSSMRRRATPGISPAQDAGAVSGRTACRNDRGCDRWRDSADRLALRRPPRCG
ncbi:transposase [Tardiphaga sp. 803_E3_N1_3]|uniref:transposase n=1 Tax=Tardiphaga sp. 803_E3_N1_3 TaxID=3240785 RepID=UPI003F24BA75